MARSHWHVAIQSYHTFSSSTDPVVDGVRLIPKQTILTACARFSGHPTVLCASKEVCVDGAESQSLRIFCTGLDFSMIGSPEDLAAIPNPVHQ